MKRRLECDGDGERDRDRDHGRDLTIRHRGGAESAEDDHLQSEECSAASASPRFAFPESVESPERDRDHAFLAASLEPRAASVLLLLLACGGPSAIPGTQVAMDFTRAGGFYAAPFPSDDLLGADGRADLGRFPNPKSVPLVQRAAQLVGPGFATSGGVFFSLDGPPGALDPGKAFILGIDPASPDYLRRVPVELSFEADGGPFGARNLLALVPVQGLPLQADASYAAVVLRSLGDAAGKPLGVSIQMARIAAGERPPAPSYTRALAALKAAGIRAADVAGLAAFTTGDATAELDRFLADARAQPPPEPLTPLAPRATYDGYCVYGTTVKMPVYQRGLPPFTVSGGGWVTDGGRPVLQRFEEANLFVTIPRAPMPAAGWPTVLHIRAGGAGEIPLADRGRHETNGGAAPSGSGPARLFAAGGWAAVQVDGPLGGKRNTTNADEQFTIFNVTNPEALRDTIRQSGLETALIAGRLAQLRPPGCEGGEAKLDGTKLALFGHSTGAWIAPLALAVEPLFKAVILSGAGGSWIENVMEKRKPLEVRPLAELLLGYEGRALTAHDPVLTMVQWAAEPADPQAYARRARGPHAFMIQGIVDHYIMPRIANTTSLGLGLDLAGPALDASSAELASTAHALDVLPLGGRRQIALPASANQGTRTAVLVQHPEDGVEDGHEAFFQTEPPQRQVRCFLESLAAGTPRVCE